MNWEKFFNALFKTDESPSEEPDVSRMKKSCEIGHWNKLTNRAELNPRNHPACDTGVYRRFAVVKASTHLGNDVLLSQYLTWSISTCQPWWGIHCYEHSIADFLCQRKWLRTPVLVPRRNIIASWVTLETRPCDALSELNRGIILLLVILQDYKRYW
jgi:hypothetical protein